MASEVIGTWYPSGYHGHYRSRTRTDVLNEYRQKAKPVPPEIFLRRFKDIRLRNPFTSHDNKSALILDASGFGQGVGKKKVETRCSSKYQPEFFAWVPAQEKHLDNCLLSVNQASYTGGSPVPTRKFLLSSTTSKDQKERRDEVPNSTYRVTYGSTKATATAVPCSSFGITPSATPQVAVGSDLPPMTANQLGNRTKVVPLKTKCRTKSAPARSLSVQDCMIWHDMRQTKEQQAASPPPMEYNSAGAGITTNEVEIETVSPLVL